LLREYHLIWLLGNSDILDFRILIIAYASVHTTTLGNQPVKIIGKTPIASGNFRAKS
jgi:hypothetical protein